MVHNWFTLSTKVHHVLLISLENPIQKCYYSLSMTNLLVQYILIKYNYTYSGNTTSASADLQLER